jgi:hypothetical protein
MPYRLNPVNIEILSLLSRLPDDVAVGVLEGLRDLASQVLEPLVPSLAPVSLGPPSALVLQPNDATWAGSCPVGPAAS